MIKRIITLLISIVFITSGCIILAQGQELDVNITSKDSSVSIVETHTIDVLENDTLAFWIQNGHFDVVITINDSVITPSSSNNIFYANISKFNITSESIIEVRYNLEKNTDEFEKILQYDTNSFTISFDGNELYSGTNLKSRSSINIALQKETERQTITVETIPNWVYIIFIIFIILLIVLFIMFTKKQKSATKKEGIGGSEEFLDTKKALLMESLKEIEKRHRSKQLSDDTYHKLKDEFKQDAVEAMKNLEDLKKNNLKIK